MADSDPKKPRFQERKRRDDDDDDLLPQPRRRRDPDDEDDRPVRPKVADRPPVLFLIGLIVGALSVTTCCGVSGWWTYASVLRSGSASGGGGGGWSLFGGYDLEIVSASRSPGFGFNSSPQVSWKAVVKTNDIKVQSYYMVMKSGSVTHAEPISVPAWKGAEVSQSMPQPALKNASGPLDLWVEKRTDPNKSGKKVSNTFTVR